MPVKQVNTERVQSLLLGSESTKFTLFLLHLVLSCQGIIQFDCLFQRGMLAECMLAQHVIHFMLSRIEVCPVTLLLRFPGLQFPIFKDLLAWCLDSILLSLRGHLERHTGTESVLDDEMENHIGDLGLRSSQKSDSSDFLSYLACNCTQLAYDRAQ